MFRRIEEGAGEAQWPPQTARRMAADSTDASGAFWASAVALGATAMALVLVRRPLAPLIISRLLSQARAALSVVEGAPQQRRHQQQQERQALAA